MRKIAILNQKGGVGKTTTAVNLSAGLAMQGKKVLLVDLDQQSNVATWFGVSSPVSLFDLITGAADFADVVVNVRKNFDIIPSDERLAALHIILGNRSDRFTMLATSLEPAATAYDFLILDCAPSLSLLHQMALMVADEVFVPVSMEYLSLVGVTQVVNTIQKVKEAFTRDVQITLIIPTFLDRRTRKADDVLDALKQTFKHRLSNPIRINTKLSESPAFHRTIFEHDPKSFGAEDYLELTERVVNGE